MIKIIFVTSRFRSGGVEKKILRLLYGFTNLNYKCSLISREDASQYLSDHISKSIDSILSKTKSEFITHINNALINNGKNIILCFRSTDYSVIIRKFHQTCPIILLNGDYISTKANFKNNKITTSLKTKLRLLTTWKKAHAIITSSNAIAEDWKSLKCIDSSKIFSPTPPVIGTDVELRSYENVEHPWLQNQDAPVVLGVGRLESSKRFDIFIQALSIANKTRKIHGIILGQGNQMSFLKNKVHELNMEDKIDFPGHVLNPYAWMRRSNALLLTSQIEPLGWVLIESLYVGTPFIANSTPPGPKSIQRETGCGFIVDPDTPEAFAEHILYTLDSEIDSAHLHNSAKRYDVIQSTEEHLCIINDVAYKYYNQH